MITDKENNMAGAVERREGVTLAWKHLTVYARVKNKKLLSKSTTTYKKIIDDVTGIIEPGNLVAIIGASGAGKSTLMACLAQRMSGDMVVEGSVLINGRQASVVSAMRGISGFMHQEDMFRGALTVSEHLHLLARLRLDRRTSRTQRTQLVDDLLRQLGLEHCRHTRIGAPGPGQRVVLSGGERKRLSFAGECLSYPPLLFCDEPTTGLDSSSALTLVSALRAMAIERRRTILISIHQPGSHLVELFHSVLLLSRGRIAFMGSTDEALDFYKLHGFECPSSYNPADFFIKQLAGLKTAKEAETDAEILCRSYLESDSFKRVEAKIECEIKKSSLSSQELRVELKLERRKSPRWLYKLFWLWYRAMLEVARNPHVQTIRLFQKIALAIMVGLCFAGTLTLDQKGIQAIQGVLFMLVTENTFSPMYAALNYFPHQLPLFAREHANGVCSRLQFYISAIASMTPVLILEPVLFIAVLYFISGLGMSLNAYFLSNLAVILCINVSTACGILFSTVFTSIPVAMAYLVPFDYCLMITSGLFVKLSTLPWHVSWIRYLSWMMYTNEALSIVSWEQVSNITCETYRADLPCLNNGEEVLEKFSFSASNLNSDFINLTILYLVFHILAFVFFFFRSNRVS